MNLTNSFSSTHTRFRTLQTSTKNWPRWIINRKLLQRNLLWNKIHIPWVRSPYTNRSLKIELISVLLLVKFCKRRRSFQIEKFNFRARRQYLWAFLHIYVCLRLCAPRGCRNAQYSYTTPNVCEALSRILHKCGGNDEPPFYKGQDMSLFCVQATRESSLLSRL